MADSQPQRRRISPAAMAALGLAALGLVVAGVIIVANGGSSSRTSTRTTAPTTRQGRNGRNGRNGRKGRNQAGAQPPAGGGQVGTVPIPPSGPRTPPPVSTGVASVDSLMAQRLGFGRNTTGGLGGAIYHVTDASDNPDAPAPGTLRYGVMQPQPLWIVFDGDYTITLLRGLLVSSNKTVDGRGHKVTITGHNQWGFQLHEVSNVIIENLNLRDFGDVTKTVCCNNMPDAVEVLASHDVWIDHNSMTMAGDKLVQSGRGSYNLTISWNHFYNQVDVVQLGNQTTGAQDANTTVTLHHNFFDHNAHRNPVVSYGRAHVFNNYVLDWRDYGTRAERNAQMYLDDNIYEAADNKDATKDAPGGDGCNDNHTRCDDRPGYINAIRNLALNGAVITPNGAGNVFDPSTVYDWSHDSADDNLKHELMTQTGWQAVAVNFPSSGNVGSPQAASSGGGAAPASPPATTAAATSNEPTGRRRTTTTTRSTRSTTRSTTTTSRVPLPTLGR